MEASNRTLLQEDVTSEQEEGGDDQSAHQSSRTGMAADRTHS